MHPLTDPSTECMGEDTSGEVDQQLDITNLSSSTSTDSEDDDLTSDGDVSSGCDTPPDCNEDIHYIPAVTHHDETEPSPVSESSSDNIPTLTAKDLQRSSAHFLFGMKEKYKLTQVPPLKGSFKEQQASLNNVSLHCT